MGLRKKNSASQTVQNVQDIADEMKRVKFSGLAQVLAALIGAAAGGAGSFAALYFLGQKGLSAAGITSGLSKAGKLIGGSMVEGVFLLAVPIMLFSVIGVALVSGAQSRKLKRQREQLSEAVILIGTQAHSLRQELAEANARAQENKDQYDALMAKVEARRRKRLEAEQSAGVQGVRGI